MSRYVEITRTIQGSPNSLMIRMFEADEQRFGMAADTGGGMSVHKRSKAVTISKGMAGVAEFDLGSAMRICLCKVNSHAAILQFRPVPST
mmetsp:Transcript_35989/g.58223  ORF Transcript_35989/g.58223 Transcript_35989/m.58223 type:complete len:90 (+) Transcript_35989:614-883(+)